MPDLSEEERIEIAQESQEKFVELVEGDVDRGDPVRVVMEDGTQHLTFFGWFPTHATLHPGGMMICSRDGDRLIDSRGVRRVRAENVHVILPLERKSYEDVREKDAKTDTTS